MTMKGVALLGFIFGFAAGSAATYFYMKSKEEVVEFKPEEPKKVEPIRENEFYRAAHDTTYDRALETLKEAKDNPIPPVSYSESYNETVEAKKDEIERNELKYPSPEEFGDNPDYSKFTLKYYKDGVLIDDQNNPLDNPEEVIGADFMDHFGEYEEDVAYIRNDRLKSDFEILFIDYDFMDS